MNELTLLITAVVLSAASLTVFFPVLAVFFPSRIGMIQRQIDARPGRSLATGLLNLLFAGLLLLVISGWADASGDGFLRILSVLLLAALLWIAALGLAAVTRLAGQRLFPERSGFARHALGSLCLGLACAFPLVGWFLLLPYLLLIGFGAWVLSLFSKESP